MTPRACASLLVAALGIGLSAEAVAQQPGETRLIFEIPITIEGDRRVFDEGIRADCYFGPRENGETDFIGGGGVDVVPAGAPPDRSQYTVEISVDVPDLAEALDQAALGWACYLLPIQSDGPRGFQWIDSGEAPMPPAQAGTCSYVEGLINTDGTITAQAPRCAGG